MFLFYILNKDFCQYYKKKTIIVLLKLALTLEVDVK